MEGIGCASRMVFLLFCLWHPPLIKRAQTHTHAHKADATLYPSQLIMIFDFKFLKDFFRICLVCAYVSRLVAAATRCDLGLNLKSFSPA